jgi:hypothetical protein
MGKHSEVFVAFDVAKKKDAVAIAEGGPTGEVRFLGEVENAPPPIEWTASVGLGWLIGHQRGGGHEQPAASQDRQLIKCLTA